MFYYIDRGKSWEDISSTHHEETSKPKNNLVLHIKLRHGARVSVEVRKRGQKQAVFLAIIRDLNEKGYWYGALLDGNLTILPLMITPETMNLEDLFIPKTQ